VLDYDYVAHERTPFDLSLDKMVALGKVAFHGSTALEALAGSPPRRLKTLRIEGDELPDYGVEVTREGEPVGTLTSPAVSPAFGPIALAVLDAGAATDGGSVDVALAEGTAVATVAPLAIYDPEKRRPRS
jgi:glycine cleavage system aminomethyltransferase T